MNFNKAKKLIIKVKAMGKKELRCDTLELDIQTTFHLEKNKAKQRFKIFW